MNIEILVNIGGQNKTINSNIGRSCFIDMLISTVCYKFIIESVAPRCSQ